MAITKAQKHELVQDYADLLSRSNGVILANNLGLPVAEMSELREQIREAGGECHVTKNRLTRIALQQVGLPDPDEMLIGPTVTGFATEDLTQIAKAIVAFSEDNERLTIKGGLMGQQVLGREDVIALAKLPPMPIQRAQLVGLISAPATRIAGALAGSLRQVVNVLREYSESEAVA